MKRSIRFPADKTAHDGDDQFRPPAFEPLELAELIVRLVLRLLPDNAGVEDNDIGLLNFRLGLVAVFFELDGETAGVRLVHLTADGPNMVCAVHIEKKESRDLPPLEARFQGVPDRL